MAGFFEKLKYYSRMIFLNRRTTFIMFLGLGISLALISESLMFLYSFQYGSFEEFNNGIPPRQMTISLGVYDVSTQEEASTVELTSLAESAIKEIDFEDRIVKIDWYISRGLFMVVNNSQGKDEIVYDFNIYAIPNDYFSALQEILYNGTIPQEIGDTIAVASQSLIDNTNLSKMGTFPMYTPVGGLDADGEVLIDLGIPIAGQYINVSGLITSETFENVKGPLETDFAAMSYYFSDQFLLTSYNNFGHFVSTLNEVPNYLSVPKGLAFGTGRVVFDLQKINSFKISSEIAQLNHLSQLLSREFEEAGYSAIIYSDIIELLRDFNKEFLILQLFSLLFITPIVGMALSLTNYSANLMKRRQRRQISSMLQRGVSQKEVVLVLIVQVIELTISAVLISFIMGYGFTWLINQSTGFLNFSGSSFYPTVNMFILYTIIGIGFVFSIIINAKNVWELSQITIQEAYSEHQVKKPLWQRLYLDIILITIGIALWLIIRIQLTGTSAYLFAFGFGTTAPILLVLGSIMLATRVYPYFIDFIAKRTWNMKNFEIIGIASRRSSRRKGDVTRSLILITLTFTLIFSSIVTIQSYHNFDSEKVYYQLGSDILVRNVNLNNNITKNTVLGIVGVQSATILTMTSQIVTYGTVAYSYITLGIDPTEFAKTAYFDKEYLGGEDPEEFFDAIQNNNDVVMQRDQLDYINTYPGDEVTIYYEKYRVGIVNKTLKVTNVYKFFPRFFVEYPSLGTTYFSFTIVGTYQNLLDMAYSDHRIAGDLLVKVADGYKIDEVATAIELELGRDVDDVIENMGTSHGSLRNTMLYGSLNASFISSLIITITAIILMILVQVLENEREVVTLKVLGMSPRQLFRMFLTEAMTVIIFGALIGASIGILAANMFTEILTFETVIPPTEMIYPPFELSVSLTILFVTGLLAAAVTSYIVFRKDTIKAIKQI